MRLTRREWMDEPPSWAGVVLVTTILAFGVFVAYLIVQEMRADRDFRDRCEAQGGIVISEKRDNLRVCARVDDANRKVIIELER